MSDNVKNNKNANEKAKGKGKEKEEVIYLKGERSGHLEKLVNRLGSWQFFKVLYVNSSLRILGMNIMMLIIALPIAYLVFSYSYLQWMGLSSYYPSSGTFIFNTTVWFGLESFLAEIESEKALQSALWGSLLFIWGTILLSGGFAVIRDSFWTGKIKVIKPFFKGVAESGPKILPFMVLLGALYTGICVLYQFMLGVMAEWLAIVLIVIVWAVYVELCVYVMVMYSVVAVHKESIGESLHDAWVLYKTNIIPNTLNFVVAFAPLVAFLILFPSTGGLSASSGLGFFAPLLSIFMLMIGLFYTVFVWQTFMMKTFRLYHPVELKRIK